MRRFQLLRGAINTMRRAYPQFMAAGGEELPREVLRSSSRSRTGI